MAFDRRIDWSYSNSRRYQRCPREFYFKEQNQSDSDDGNRSKSNTTLRGRSASGGSIVGQAVHQTIQEQIQTWHSGGNPNLQAAKERVSSLLTEYCRKYGVPGEQRGEKTGPRESTYAHGGVPSLVGTARGHLKRFFRFLWSQIKSHQYILHERTASFEVGESTVWVRPDLVTRSSSGEFVVTDWKTSATPVRNLNTLQLYIYGLWAFDQYEPDLNRIRLQFGLTGTGGFERERVTQSELDVVRSRIQEESAMWNNASSRNDFEPDPDRVKCNRCSYVSNCAPGQEIIAESEDSS